ncbi:MAG: helix-turn-helix domain-containing protein [Ruminococcus sp.]|nr:helix-turn-helix domain-containing protein [Ruminococcus sp.]
MTTYVIRKENIISQSALTSLKNGKSVTTDTIERLCKCLNCQPGDIMEYIPDESIK